MPPVRSFSSTIIIHVANQDTPHKDRTVVGTGPHTATARHSLRKPTLQEFREQLIQEMANRSVPLSLQDFLNTFLPVPHNQKPRRATATLVKKFSVLKDVKTKDWKEDDIAKTFVKVVNDAKLTPGLKLALSQYNYDANDASKQKVDAAFFPQATTPTDGKPHWAEQLVSVEFKKGETKNDPFEDNEKKAMDPDASSRKEVRSQIMSYAQKVFERQPRTHLFMLFVIGQNFRVLRWDRSGVVVTPLIDYVLHPDLLYEFLWRIGRASMAQLGLDPTAKLIKPGSDEYKKMDELAKKVATDLVAECSKVVANGDENNMFAYVREKFNESLEEDWPRWKLSVPQEDGSMRYFLVGKPTFTTSSLVGRATQGYVAMDPLAKEPKKQLVWLKDAWRAFYDLVEAEGVVLQQLKNASVQGIPTLVCHGDLPGQATVTPDIWEKNQKALEEEQKRAAEKKLKRTTRKKQKQKRVARTTAVSAPAVAPSAASAGAAVPASAASGTKRRRDEIDDEQALLPPPHGVEGSQADDADDKCPLRRHRHYRIVVEEVGLPLEQFENGFHLVSVIHDCIGAHKHAAQAGILHRDISGGNILIYPQVVEDLRSPDRRIVKLRGLLTDWELSKDIKVKGRPRHARQPERIGTWQYMSIALINEPTKAVEISDELEAFFHVLLYYAVRYLKSNCADVSAYMELYFEAYWTYGGRYRCGSLKTSTITNGELRTSEATSGVIRFNTPIDHILRTILGWLKAYYDIHADEYIRVEEDDNPPDENIDFDYEPSECYNVFYDESLVSDDEIDAPELPAPKVHSEKTFKDARKICLHDHILALLFWCMNKDARAKLPPGLRWQKTDKVPDGYPDSSRRRFGVAPSGTLGTHNDNDNDDDSNKRLKSNSGAAVPVQHPPQTPPRKRHHSSIGIVDSGFAIGSRPAVGSCPP
ncbi:hypothetical protein ONZ51_g9357 [Trametes cubensis]|uniref:Fungal-type protein kinase domain-containing protein n=1 Tax=Trametes cubensis TaxID=1111947 RepID=A0AAD7TLY6_9APHY|nr:hypothetical protein ONZ51_g9357 [Trametes cubensis]